MNFTVETPIPEHWLRNFGFGIIASFTLGTLTLKCCSLESLACVLWQVISGWGFGLRGTELMKLGETLGDTGGTRPGIL